MGCAMLQYLHGIALVILIFLAIGTPLIAMAFYLSPRIHSQVVRVIVVWPLFGLGFGALGVVTFIILGHVLLLLWFAMLGILKSLMRPEYISPPLPRW